MSRDSEKSCGLCKISSNTKCSLRTLFFSRQKTTRRSCDSRCTFDAVPLHLALVPLISASTSHTVSICRTGAPLSDSVPGTAAKPPHGARLLHALVRPNIDMYHYSQRAIEEQSARDTISLRLRRLALSWPPLSSSSFCTCERRRSALRVLSAQEKMALRC